MIVFLIGGLLCVLNHFRIEISTNQEIYMALAKWWADPSWIPQSFYFSDPAGTRIGFTAIMYPVWKWFSFEAVSMGATFINLFAIGGFIFLIAKQASKVNFFFFILMHLTLFSGLGDKSFYSGEWIFGGAEPKTFAYIFSLWGLLLFMKGKHTWTFLLLALGAYFHVLVAGWILLILLLDTWYTDGFKRSFKSGLIFVAGIAPLFFYLLSSYFQKGVSSFAGADDIFIYHLRNHLRPWLVEGREYRFYGGLFYAFVGCLVAFYRLKRTDPKIALLYRLSIYAFIVPAFFTLLAPWDWFTPFLKIFPFRLTMMQKILLFVAVGLEVCQKFETLRFKKQITIGFAVVLLVSGALRLNKNIVKRWNNWQEDSLVLVAQYLETSYPAGTSVFYIETNTLKSDDEMDPLSRMARVNVFFVNKFLPFSPEKILEWQRRLELTKSIQKDPAQIERLKKEPIDLILTKKELNLRLIHKLGEFNIYDKLQ